MVREGLGGDHGLPGKRLSYKEGRAAAGVHSEEPGRVSRGWHVQGCARKQAQILRGLGGRVVPAKQDAGAAVAAVSPISAVAAAPIDFERRGG